MRFALEERRSRHAVAAGRKRCPRQPAGTAIRTEIHDRAQRREPRGVQRRRGRRAQLRRKLGQQLDVVSVAEAAGQDEDRDARLPQRVLELAQPIRGIDVDENRAGLRRGVLQDEPLRAVRAPDPDAVARLDAERQQSAGNALDFRSKSGVRIAERLVARNEGVGVRMGGSDPIEAHANRLAEQRLARRSTDIGRLHGGAIIAP